MATNWLYCVVNLNLKHEQKQKLKTFSKMTIENILKNEDLKHFQNENLRHFQNEDFEHFQNEDFENFQNEDFEHFQKWKHFQSKNLVD